MFRSLRQGALKLLPIMIYHQVLDVVNKTRDENTEVEKLMTVPADVEGAWLTPFWDPGHVQAPTSAVDQASKQVLLPPTRHHAVRIPEKLKINQGGRNCHSETQEGSSSQPLERGL